MPEQSLTYNQNRSTYYHDLRVQVELLKVMEQKEVIFMSYSNHAHCIRGLSFRNNQYLNYANNFFSFYERDYNIYISVAKYRYIPFFDMNLKNRSALTHKWFTDQAQQEIIDYDFFLDFDGKLKDHKRMVKEVRDVCRLLQFEKVKFYIIPSGSSYQIVVKNYGVKQDKIKGITEALKTVFGLKTLDMIGIGSYYKIMKCPYSVCKDIVCFPLDSDMISGIESLNYRHFSLEHITPEKVYNRGFQWQNKDSGQLQLLSFLDKFKLV